MAAQAPARPLACSLGWHAPDPLARWNDGYYFTRCRRCGTDLVRTAFSKWHEPHGYRVVWQRHPPPDAVTAALVAEAAGEEAPAEELPIEAVLRQLREDDEAAGAVEPSPEDPGEEGEISAADELLLEGGGEEAVEAPQAPPPPVKRSRVPDFMDDGTNTPYYAGFEGYSEIPAGIARPPAESVQRDETEPPAIAARIKQWVEKSLEAARGDRADRAEGPVAPPPPPPETEDRRLSPAMAMAAILALAVLTTAMISLWPSLSTRTIEVPAPQQQRAAPTPAPKPAPPAPARPQVTAAARRPPAPAPLPPAAATPRPVTAFVTASLLNCRAAPARQGRSVRRLARGDQVQFIARDGDWVSLSYQGRQCWALLRYFSVQPPFDAAPPGSRSCPAPGGCRQPKEAMSGELGAQAYGPLDGRRRRSEA